MAPTGNGKGLLERGLRRRAVRLRQRRLPRVDGRAAAQQTGGGHGRHPRRPRLLGGGLRRRPLRLRRRPLLRVDRQHSSEPTGGGHGRHPGRPGYWLVASDGGIFAFGDAAFYGSTGGHPPQPTGGGHGRHPRRRGLLAGGLRRRHLRLRRRPLLRVDRRPSASTRPVVGMAASPNGSGYWFVASDGGIFAFGDARFYGSMGEHRPQPTGGGHGLQPGTAGYWLVAADGGLFSFGNAAVLRIDAPGVRRRSRHRLIRGCSDVGASRSAI